NVHGRARHAAGGANQRTSRIASSRDEERIMIAFSDTGLGIPRDLQQRIFDPFFTTKEVGTGTGLGLSITYSILKEYGGDISVISESRRRAPFPLSPPF